MREKLLDGITQPDNDSSLKINHGVRAIAENGARMSVSFGSRVG